MSTWAVM